MFIEATEMSVWSKSGDIKAPEILTSTPRYSRD